MWFVEIFTLEMLPIILSAIWAVRSPPGNEAYHKGCKKGCPTQKWVSHFWGQKWSKMNDCQYSFAHDFWDVLLSSYIPLRRQNASLITIASRDWSFFLRHASSSSPSLHVQHGLTSPSQCLAANLQGISPQKSPGKFPNLEASKPQTQRPRPTREDATRERIFLDPKSQELGWPGSQSCISFLLSRIFILAGVVKGLVIKNKKGWQMQQGWHNTVMKGMNDDVCYFLRMVSQQSGTEVGGCSLWAPGGGCPWPSSTLSISHHAVWKQNRSTVARCRKKLSKQSWQEDIQSNIVIFQLLYHFCQLSQPVVKGNMLQTSMGWVDMMMRFFSCWSASGIIPAVSFEHHDNWVVQHVLDSWSCAPNMSNHVHIFSIRRCSTLCLST